MKINWKVRLKNPYFWIGLIGVILATLGIKPEDLSSWPMLLEQIKAVAANPFLLFSVIFAVLGVITDPTTKGVNDSRRALTYTKPREDGENYHDSDFGQ